MLVRAAADVATCRDNRPASDRDRQLAGAIAREADRVEADAVSRQDGAGYELAEHLRRASRDLLRCGFDMVGHKCRECGIVGHPLPFTCKKSALCVSCARVDSARKRQAYGLRIRRSLNGAGHNCRLMFSTWALRPYDGESIGESLARGREAWRLVWGAVYDVPHGRREWALYFDLWPVLSPEISRHGTPAKARRHRRRSVVAQRRTWHCGAVAPHELGSRTLNPHIHALILGPYVKQELLSRAWRIATGNSGHVHIQQVHGVGRAIRETLKYLTKFHDLTVDQLVTVYVGTLRRKSRVIEHDDGSTVVKFSYRTMRSVELYGSFRKRHGDEGTSELRCFSCGGKMRPFGWIPGQLYRMGVTQPPEDYQFRPRRPPD